MPNQEVERLLEELKDEREKYTSSDREKMKLICDRLVALGHYPPVSGIGLEPLRMVEHYGVYWTGWREPLLCQHCKADLRDLKNGAPFKREIGLIHNDHMVALKCPDCGKDIWKERIT